MELSAASEGIKARIPIVQAPLRDMEIPTGGQTYNTKAILPVLRRSLLTVYMAAFPQQMLMVRRVRYATFQPADRCSSHHHKHACSAKCEYLWGGQCEWFLGITQQWNCKKPYQGTSHGRIRCRISKENPQNKICCKSVPKNQLVWILS